MTEPGWIRRTMAEAKARSESLPPHARPAVTRPVTPSRPVPVPGQAAREAAVEAVARIDQLPKVWRDAAWAYRLDGVLDHAEALERCADELLAALSAAPGQEQP